MQTREEVIEYAKGVAIVLDWKEGDRLRTHQVRSAILTHPRTGEEVWFNHMSFWHTANLSKLVREEMLAHVGFDSMPYHTFYGDGSPIPDEVARHIAECYEAEKMKFSWQKGDLMCVDNMLGTHGREPFTGERRIRVAITEQYARPPFSLPEA